MRHWLPGGTIERWGFDRAVGPARNTFELRVLLVVSERFDDGRGLQLHRVAVDLVPLNLPCTTCSITLPSTFAPSQIVSCAASITPLTGPITAVT